ncbi:sugar phosphate isomerase/epimerase family protein [Gracilibacillus salinarum]|uniref:TIM barrel protein n=1 Tax=Gracilibacillus salinarum TaxID=2932255 RepID=A0ABY4GLD4_9BACI|nr:TIM barrel protein [Gracilibacillus salinarum]UOQ84770.1 TIM barrel protein [Gracilibacillus salinarum]
MKLGMCSITFRHKNTHEIIELTKKAELDAIEWGADVHVPVGDIQTAEDVGARTRNAGLEVSSYGSYYRLAEQEAQHYTFETVCQTAKALGAPAIRVWAGALGSAKASGDYRERVAGDARRIGDLAYAEGISIHLEFHDHTLTDTKESAQQLLQNVSHHNVYTYWQPPNQVSVAERLASIEAVKPWITNIHVFHWYSFEKRMHLSEGIDEWHQYLEKISQDGKERYLLMEFVKDDDVDQFLQDARALQKLKYSNHTS